MLKSTEAYKQIMRAIQCLQDARNNDRHETGRFIHSVFELEVAENKLREAKIWIEQYRKKRDAK